MHQIALFVLGTVCLSAGAVAQTAVTTTSLVFGQDGATHSFKIATLAFDNAGGFDHLHLIATLNTGDGSFSNMYIDATFANRAGFHAMYTQRGATSSPTVRLVAYQSAPGASVDLYFVMTNGYNVLTYSILESIQETVYSSPSDTLGTLPDPSTIVFDSNNAAYLPATYTSFSGQLGVGTVNPTSKLHLVDQFVSAATNNSNTGGGNAAIQATGPSRTPGLGAALSFMFPADTDGSNPVEQARIVATPDNANNFDASGRLYFQVKYLNSAIGAWDWRNALFMNSLGNVGIGTTTPAATLDVAGNVRASSVQASSFLFTDGSSLTSASGLAPGSAVSAGTTSPVGAITVGNPSPDGQATATHGIVFTDTLNGSGSQWTHAAIYTVGSSGYNGSLVFATDGDGALDNNPTEKMRIDYKGNVGIGTSTPGAQLEVNGNIQLTKGSGAQITFPDSSVQSTAWNGTTLGGDYAESVDVLGDRKTYQPGDVIAMDESSPGRFTKSQTPYSKLVAGIFSTKPGLTGRRVNFERPDKEAEVPMAMMGIVPTKVSTENGPIAIGDLLVSASLPGYAMKGTDPGRMMGAVIGKALAPLTSGSAVIEVLISLQ